MLALVALLHWLHSAVEKIRKKENNYDDEKCVNN